MYTLPDRVNAIVGADALVYPRVSVGMNPFGRPFGQADQ